jgi:hypothetical protein
MEGRLSRFIGYGDQKLKQQALKNSALNLPDSILYMINPSKFQQLGRQKFSEYIATEMTANQVMNKIIYNEDMYADDVSTGRSIIRREFKKLMPGYDPFSEKYYEEDKQVSNKEGDDYQEEYDEDELYDEEENLKEEKEETQLEKWTEQYEEEQKTAEQWVNEYEKSILDFFVSPLERQMIQMHLKNLLLEQKKFIVEKVLDTKSLMNLSPEKQRKYVMDFIKTLAKRGIQGSKY